MKTLRLNPRTAQGAISPHAGQHAPGPLAVRINRTGVTAVMGCLLAAAIPGVVPLCIAQSVYYVDNTSPACSNSGPGTKEAPYCTISAALTGHHDPGTTINVMPGVYREQVAVPGSGASGSPLTLRALGSPDRPVVIDGADDFSDPSRWTQHSGDVWLASSVNWSPRQVFADGLRLAPSTASPEALPPRSFVHVTGTGLYVNAGGGNPASHGTLVGRRTYGLVVSGKSWVNIRGFTFRHAEDKAILLQNGADQCQVTDNRVTLNFKFGIQLAACSGTLVARNASWDNGGHGIALTAGSTGCTIEDNESYGNADPVVRQGNGLYLYGCSSNLIQRNRFHDNEDTGLQMQSSSNNNISIQNRSWNNGDHGFDHLASSGNVHVGDVAFGNFMDGFSVEGNSPNQALYNCIAVDNGLTTNEFDLWVDQASTAGFVSNDNILWNSTGQPPVKYGSTVYSRVQNYSASSGQDTRTIQADPRFVDPAHGDFHLASGSPAIDNANSEVPNWPATDAEGHERMDDPETPNNGRGPVTHADRGALEFQPTAANQPPVAKLTVTPSSGGSRSE